MESVLVRYRNATVLVLVLFVQVIALATQVRRTDPTRPEAGSTRLIRVWTVGAISPIQRAFVNSGRWIRGTWAEYADLRGVREENERLQQELDQLRLQQARMSEDAVQGRRLQALLDFKEQFASKTVAAQVIGTSGTDNSRTIYIDKGAKDGLKVDQPVITPHGIVGKVSAVFGGTAQVLLINDQSSGAGVFLEQARLRGILRGRPTGEVEVQNIMATENVEVGQAVLTTGGDRIFPRGLPVGVVTAIEKDRDDGLFLAVKVKTSANLNRLEEVLVITEVVEEPVDPNKFTSPLRASDMLADRLPTFKKLEEQQPAKPGERRATPTAPGAVAPANPPAGGAGASAGGSEAATPPRPKPQTQQPEGQSKPSQEAAPPVKPPGGAQASPPPPASNPSPEVPR